MNQKKGKAILFVMPLLAVFTALPLQAQSGKLALVVFKKGTASIVRAGKEQPAKVKDLIQEKDEIRTGADGELSLQLSSGVLIKIAAKSTLVVEGIQRDGNGTSLALKLNNGTLLGKADKDGKNLDLKVQSPTAIASVRGTEFIVDANKESTSVLVDEGVVEVSDQAGEESVSVEPGNKVVSDGKELITGVLDAYEKQRFVIFDRFEKEKQKSFEVVVDQLRRNRELMEQQRQKMP